jgi:anti-sigma-K factor RskA
MNQNFELKLQAWMDGELSASDARRIGQEIAADAEAGPLIAELQAVKTAMAGNELAWTVPETREFYWSKIERQIQREARNARPFQAPRQAAWRRWLAPLSGFAALACMLYLAVKPPALPTFDEISSTGEGMETVTFNDQSAGMTVVWLADTEQAQPTETPTAASPETGDSEVEME